jgi:large subunit ribosomal protein L23
VQPEAPVTEPLDIIRRPIVTEKASAMKAEANKVVFDVKRTATKIDIKRAVEAAFSVTVTDVATMNFRGKQKRVGRTMGQRSNWKKAVITLKEGDDIDVLGQGAQT